MAWLDGWAYKKAVTLSRASGAVSDYQMKLLVGESSGATGEDVDCNSHILSNFDDLRFTTDDGTTLLDYWIESITGSTPNRLATVWIEFGTIGTGATTFYMYYGKTSAAAVSSGANTFIIYDDFERGNDGDAIGGDWTQTAGSVKISTAQDIGNVTGFFGTRAMKLATSAPTSTATIPCAASANIAVRFRIYKETAAGLAAYSEDGTHAAVIKADTNELVYYLDAGGYVSTGVSITADAWQVLGMQDFVWGASPTVDVMVNDAVATNNASVHFADTGYVNLIALQGWTDDIWIDNFMVRNFRTTEPAWGSWGSEVAWGVKTINGLAWASVKTLNEQTRETTATINGLA